MNLRDLEYLVALADHRNFHRAAEICHVSQPTLSAQIRKLEDELGVVLFERAPRNLLLTEAGQAVLDHARRALIETDQIRAVAQRLSLGGKARMRLGVFPTLGPYLLPHIVPGFASRFPQLELRLTEEKSKLLIRHLIEGRIDAALLALPVDEPQLTGHEIFTEPFRLAVPSAHPFAEQARVTPEHLEGQQLMLLEDGHCLRDQAMDLCRISGAQEMTDFRGTSLETLRQMVIAGVGMTLLPAMACQNLPGLTVLPIDDDLFRRRIGLFWRKSNPSGTTMTEIATFIEDAVRAQMALAA